MVCGAWGYLAQEGQGQLCSREGNSAAPVGRPHFPTVSIRLRRLQGSRRPVSEECGAGLKLDALLLYSQSHLPNHLWGGGTATWPMVGGPGASTFLHIWGQGHNLERP